MKTRCYYLQILVFIGCCSILTAGCMKWVDYLKYPGDTDYKPCNIKKITAFNQSVLIDGSIDTAFYTYTFTYSSLGNPVSVITNSPGTGNPNFSFKYDKYNRLREFIRPYGNGGYEQMDRYGYNAKGQAVLDTGYVFGLMSGTEALPSPFVDYKYLEYDAQNRVLHEKDSILNNGHFEFILLYDYAYDANGNLITGAVYDNKMNMYRTNKVWMFILRDYSVNNQITNGQYNEFGLPVHYFGGSIKMFPAATGDIHIDYFCH